MPPAGLHSADLLVGEHGPLEGVPHRSIVRSRAATRVGDADEHHESDRCTDQEQGVASGHGAPSRTQLALAGVPTRRWDEHSRD
jgi:hypothetical protein